MEPESPLPCSQQPATGTYLKPDASNPQLPNYFPGIQSVVLPSTTGSLLDIAPTVKHKSQILHL
jgi:hypothetical protein